jgi:spermidine synthase
VSAKNLYLTVLVFVSGAAVLAVELLGTRVLGPFYGVSLYLWTAQITVALLALSVGYAVGGRMADRQPRLERLCQVLLGAGAWLLVLPWLRDPVLRMSEPLGLRAAVLVASFLLFAPPLTLLGMVAPYALRLRATSLGEVGRTAGDLYALSTVGSVLAALLTGFVLVPYVGVGKLIFGVGALLVFLGLVGLLAARSTAAGVGATLALAPVAFLGFGAAEARPDPAQGLLSVEHSPYAEIRVVERDGTRYMLIDGGTHTIVDASTFESVFSYVHVVDLLNHVIAEPGRLLLVGLGGGSVAKLFSRQGWDVEAVEIDAVVTRVARRDFALSEAEARVHHADGRGFLENHDERYDAIVLDAFGSSSIPFHLVTREAFALVARRLAPEGVLAINIECVGWDDVLVRSLAATLREEFAHVLALPIAEPPDQLGNLILMASQRELELATEIPPTHDRFSTVYDKNHAWDNRFEPPRHDAPVLTDDLNPVDLWSDRINLAARRDLHDRFGGGLGW